MTPSQWQRVTAVFGEARDVPQRDRAAFIDLHCADDDEIRREVLGLLDADLEDTFLEHGARVQPVDLLDQAGGHTHAPGEVLGSYRIERLLARGGMGVIYVAVDSRLARRVTLKVLPAAAARDPRARARLQREARTAALLRHPHILSVHALEDLGDTLVIVSEYVEGRTLADEVRERGPLSRDRWYEVALTLGAALAAAHAAHVVHRDVKPSNIVLGQDGLRLVDFGIALGQADGGDTRLTQVGQSSGTPLAQAPEQLEGGPATALSDQFAYGLVLYEAASGRLPFGDGPVAGVWARMLRDAPMPLAAVAPQLDSHAVALVHQCLARRPEDRFASMHDVVEALTTALSAPGETRSPDGEARSRDGRARSPSGPSPRPGLAARSGHPAVNVTSRWMDLHQAVTTAVYLALLWPGWLVAGALTPRWRAAAHLSIVCLAAIATSLRLHLWFSEKHYPRPVAAPRHRWWPVLTSVDVGYAGLLGWISLLTADVRLIPAVVTAGLAVSLVMASLVIEPATRRATRQDTGSTSWESGEM